MVAETYELQAGLVAAYTYEDVMVVIGQDEWLWRDPTGEVQIRPGNYAPRRVRVHCNGQQLLIAELTQGRVECYRYPDGELLWMHDGFGELLDAACTAEYAWLLDCPRIEDGVLWPRLGDPEDPGVVLYQLDLMNGNQIDMRVQPPEQRYWTHAINSPLVWLEGDEQQIWITGLCSVERPVYGRPNVYPPLPTDVPFIFRPKQGELELCSVLLPGGLQRRHDVYAPMSYYLQEDYLVDVLQTPDVTECVIRAHSLLTGELIWERQLSIGLSGQSYQPSYPFRAGGCVIVDTGQGVVCLDVTSGAEQWSFVHSSRLRWVAPMDTGDVVFGLANGMIVRMAASGDIAWQYEAAGLTDLDRLEVSSSALIIRDSGIREGAESIVLCGSYGGKYTALSLNSGSEIPLVEDWLQYDKFTIAGEFVWQIRQKAYRPGPYNGDKAIYRLRGFYVPIFDLNLRQEERGMLVRPDYLLVAEQSGSKTRLVMLRKSR